MLWERKLHWKHFILSVIYEALGVLQCRGLIVRNTGSAFFQRRWSILELELSDGGELRWVDINVSAIILAAIVPHVCSGRIRCGGGWCPASEGREAKQGLEGYWTVAFPPQDLENSFLIWKAPAPKHTMSPLEGVRAVGALEWLKANEIIIYLFILSTSIYFS